VVEARQAVEEARQEVRQAWREARAEVRQAWNDASNEVRKAYQEVLECEANVCPAPPAAVTAAPLEQAEGLPVPIVPGTRVTEAKVRPPAPPIPPVPPRAVVAINHRQAAKVTTQAAAPAPAQTRTVEGQVSATEDRAKDDARRALRESVLKWLGPEVHRSWTPPARLLEAMILETRIIPVVKSYGTLYVAELKVDVSPQRRARFVESYDRDLVRDRLTTLGAVLAFVLICLAAMSGYIRADEATKGYYTNRLRMLAAAGVGAAGAIIYNMVV
jgi:hypothetical protein